MRPATVALFIVVVSNGPGCSSATAPTVPDGGADAGAISLPDAPGCSTGGASSSLPAGATDPLCVASLPSVSYAKDVVPVLSHCTGEICHAPWQYQTLVGQHSTACCDHRWLVEPGQPSSSHVIQAVRGVGACVPQMPLDQGALADPDITTLVAWVCQGARND